MRRARALAQEGVTLAEVIIATFIVSIGLVAVASGFQFATAGISTGRSETMAAFLAEQRLEQLKSSAISNYNGAALAAGTTTEYCQTSDIGTAASNCQAATMTGGLSYTRVTTIADNAGGPGCTGAAAQLCKRIHVRVTHRPITSRGDSSQTRQLDVYTLVAPRN